MFYYLHVNREANYDADDLTKLGSSIDWWTSLWLYVPLWIIS